MKVGVVWGLALMLALGACTQQQWRQARENPLRLFGIGRSPVTVRAPEPPPPPPAPVAVAPAEEVEPPPLAAPRTPVETERVTAPAGVRSISRAEPAARLPTPPPAPPPPAFDLTGAPMATRMAMDPNGLKVRLEGSRAIGAMTKITLKNQIDDLVAQFRAYHHGDRSLALNRLRDHYDLLLKRLAALLQDKDRPLYQEIAGARETLWTTLSDPKKFARL